MRLLLCLFAATPILVSSATLETCYRVFFIFLPVAESCVKYSRNGEEIRIIPWARTIAVGSLVKRVNNRGESLLIHLKPRLFVFLQREGPYIRDHRYVFGEDGVRYSIVRYRKGKEEKEEGFYASGEILYDPFSASLLIYLNTPSREGGSISLFYDGKVRKVTYRTVGEEEVEVFGRTYRTWKVVFNPEMETKGLLKPRGLWYAWIDKETNIPVRLKVSFTIGSAYIYLEKVKGRSGLLRDIRDERIGPR